MAAAVIAGAAAVALDTAPAMAGPSCGDRAEWLYPHDKWARKTYKQHCKDREQAWNDNRKGKEPGRKPAKRRGVWIEF